MTSVNVEIREGVVTGHPIIEKVMTTLSHGRKSTAANTGRVSVRSGGYGEIEDVTLGQADRG